MPIEYKYYKFIDPDTGLQSKDVGFVHSRVIHEYAAKTIKGVKTVVKDNQFNRITERKPKGSLTEISKEEFDALRLSDESQEVTNKRNKQIAAVDKFVEMIKKRERTPAERAAQKAAQKAARKFIVTEVLEPVEKK